jgi:KaiC/GvpD/RAD55 family RecA-like ATPase
MWRAALINLLFSARRFFPAAVSQDTGENQNALTGVHVYQSVPMRDRLRLRTPTGIASLDPVLDGGVPPGSVVLLLGEPGAGSIEFVETSIIRLSTMKRNGAGGEHLLLPDGISYVTLTRMREDVLKEMALSFNPESYNHLAEEIVFHDLSELYFDASIVPPDWYGEGSVIERLQKKQRKENGDILAELARVLSGCPENSLIVMDSLTDIAPPLTGSPGGMRSSPSCAACSRWQNAGTSRSIFLLTSGILDRSRELEIADCVDATILFRWEETGAQRRQRVMHFEKFRGVMPRLEDKDLVKFAVKISAAEGFEVQQHQGGRING